MEQIETAKGSEKEAHKKRYFPEIYKALGAGLALLAFAGPIDESKAEKKEKTANSESGNSEIQSRQRDWSDMQIKRSETSGSNEIQWPEVRCTFFEGVDEEGRPKFNVWSLIAMLQAEFPYLEKKDGKMTFQIPFEHARLFADDEKAGKPRNSGHFPAMERYIKRDLIKQFEEILYGFDWSKKVYKYSRERALEGLKIKSIEITGTASPDEGANPETMKLGTINRENVELAFARGKTAFSLAKEWLERSSVNLKQLEEAASNIQAKELQFTNRELFELQTLSRKMKGHDDMEKIFNLIKEYNRGNIKDEENKYLLDQMVGAKRMTEITIYYEGNKAKRVLIPIPLLPIIIGIFLVLAMFDNYHLPRKNA